jgi:hypothetical protein
MTACVTFYEFILYDDTPFRLKILKKWPNYNLTSGINTRSRSEHNMEFRKWSRIILLLWAISISVVIYYSLIPRVEFPIDFWNADKLYHCAAYGWLAVLPMIGLAIRRFALSAALSMIILGILLEIGQYFIPSRTCSLLDIAANSLGVVLGIFLGNYLRTRYKDANFGGKED